MAKVTSASFQSSQKSTPTMPASSTTSPKIDDQAGGEELVQGVDIVGHTGDQAPDRPAVEVAHRQPLEVGEDVCACRSYMMYCPISLHHVALDVEHQEGRRTALRGRSRRFEQHQSGDRLELEAGGDHRPTE